jgi:hypothetical protein
MQFTKHGYALPTTPHCTTLFPKKHIRLKKKHRVRPSPQFDALHSTFFHETVSKDFLKKMRVRRDFGSDEKIGLLCWK